MWWIAILIVLAIFAFVYLKRRQAPPEFRDDARFDWVELEREPELGKTYSCIVKVTNTGSKTWQPSEVKLGIVGDECPFAPVRVELTDPIKPGKSVSFVFKTHFDKAGPYTFCWRMVRELARWFGETKEWAIDVKEPEIKPLETKKIICWSNLIDEMNPDYPIRKMAEKLSALEINVLRLVAFFVGRTLIPYLKVKGKYDLGKWNPDYWERLKYVVRTLLELRIRPQVDWVDFRCIAVNELWEKHPWNKANGGFAEKKSDILSKQGQEHIRRFIVKGIQEIESLIPGDNVKNWILHGTDNEAKRLVGAEPRPRQWIFFVSRVLQDAGVSVENIVTSAQEDHSKIALVRPEDDDDGFLTGKYKKAVGFMSFHGWVDPKSIVETLLWMSQVHKFKRGIKFIISTDGGNSGADLRCDKYHKGFRPGPADIKTIIGGLLRKQKKWIDMLDDLSGVSEDIARDIIDQIAGAEYLDWITRKGDFDNPLIEEIARTLRETVG